METNQIKMAENQITLHEYQNKAWWSKKRFICFCSGVQGGKTFFGSIWIINEVESSGWSDFIILAPTYKVLQQSTLQKFFEIVPRGYGVHNKADSTFKTATGKTIFFRSADKPESIEGITAGAIWADEVGLMKPDAWLFMQRRVSRTMGRILMTFTPKALNWVYYDLYKPWLESKGKHSDIEFIQFRSVDSPYFPEEEFNRAKQTMTEHQFKLSYEGEFAKAEGLVYPSFGSPNIVDDFEIPEEWRRAGGIDFGYINPFCALGGALSPDDVLYIYKCHYRSGMTLREHSEFLNPDIVYFYDPSGRQEAEELISMGFELVPANNDIDMGIDRVNVRIMGQQLSEDKDGLMRIEAKKEGKRLVRLKVFRSCSELIEEMGLYQYDKNQTTGEWRDKPLKANDHSVDALRYLVMGMDEYGEPEIMVLG